jgi:predicted thioesterase
MLETNVKYSIEIIVSESDTAIAHKSGGLPVYATPAMIGLMEAAAYNLLKQEEYNLDSVGTEINVKHNRACLVGTKVTAEATVTNVNGNWVNFNVTAYDQKGEIGNGTHTRYIIDAEKFLNKLK